MSAEGKPMEYLFSVANDDKKDGRKIRLECQTNIWIEEKFSLKLEENQTTEDSKNKNLFLIVRSLKNEDSSQKVLTVSDDNTQPFSF